MIFYNTESINPKREMQKEYNLESVTKSRHQLIQGHLETLLVYEIL